MQQMNSITAPLLYTRIITNDFPNLIYGLRIASTQANPSRNDKAQLLSLCRHLHLEPPNKLLNEGTLGQMHPESKAARKCMEELTKCFKAVKDTGGLRVIFPSLESLSTSAYTSAVPAVYGDKWLSSKTTRALVRGWEEIVGDANVPIRCSTIGRTYPFQGHQYYPTDHDMLPEYHPPGRPVPQSLRKQRHNKHFVHTDIVSFLWVAPTDVQVVYFLERSTKPVAVLDAMTDAVRAAEKLLDDYPTAGQVAERHCELDVDIVIALADLDVDRECVIGHEDAMEQLQGQVQTGVQCIMDLYNGAFEGLRRTRDIWTITITDGVPQCPACGGDSSQQHELGAPVVCRKTLEWTCPASARPDVAAAS